MARRTLLEMVQNILNATDGDEVNSIGDTIESMQIAEVVRETYDYITDNIEIPGKAGIIKLDASIDVDRPNIMVCPDDAEEVEWIKYNGKEIQYLEPLAFVNYVSMQQTNGTLFGDFYILTDRDPQFYTSFDDNELVFNAYDSALDATLQQSKTLCWGQKVMPFLMEDDFVPALPLNLFSRLLAESKATCFINYRQTANSKEEQRSRQQLVRNQNDRYKAGRIRPIDRLPNYGRRSPRRVISRGTS